MLNKSSLSKMFKSFLRVPVSSVSPSLIRFEATRQLKQRALPIGLRFYSEENKKNTEESKSKEEAESQSQETSKEAQESGEVDELKKLNEDLQACQKDAAKFKDSYIRAIADFRNLQESTKREISKSKDLALKAFAKDLLQTADTFDIALKSLQEYKNDESKEFKDLLEGVSLTRNMLARTFERHGIEKFEPVGEKFDPNTHEATFEIPQPDKEPGTVFFVQQPGYFLNKRVLRPAKVGVVKASE